MPECGYSLTRNFPYKNRIYDSVLIRETIWVRENPYSGIFYPVSAFTAVETLDESLEKNYRGIFRTPSDNYGGAQRRLLFPKSHSIIDV